MIEQAVVWCAPPATVFYVMKGIYEAVRREADEPGFADDPVIVYNAWDWLERRLTTEGHR
ncbi:MAG: hypothetical protein ACLP01_17235 [Solirubrobacteraceae bacterium]